MYNNGIHYQCIFDIARQRSKKFNLGEQRQWTYGLGLIDLLAELQKALDSIHFVHHALCPFWTFVLIRLWLGAPAR